MAEREVTLKRGERPLVEHGCDEAHVLHDRDGLAIADGHAGGLLASVLQREKAVVDELRDRQSRGVDPEDSARFSHAVILPRRLSLPRKPERDRPVLSAR